MRVGDRSPGSVAFVGSAVVDRGFNGKCDADSHIATCAISDAGTVKTHPDTKLSVIGMMFFAVGGCKKNIPAALFGSVMLVGSEVMLRFVFFSIG